MFRRSPRHQRSLNLAAPLGDRPVGAQLVPQACTAAALHADYLGRRRRIGFVIVRFVRVTTSGAAGSPPLALRVGAVCLAPGS